MLLGPELPVLYAALDNHVLQYPECSSCPTGATRSSTYRDRCRRRSEPFSTNSIASGRPTYPSPMTPIFAVLFRSFASSAAAVEVPADCFPFNSIAGGAAVVAIIRGGLRLFQPFSFGQFSPISKGVGLTPPKPETFPEMAPESRLQLSGHKFFPYFSSR